MNFFQKLFGTSKTTLQTESTNPTASSPKSVAKYIRIYPAKSYIVGKCIQGDFNDPFFFTNNTSMVLDVVPNDDVNDVTFSKSNKYYYENINNIVNLTYEQFSSVAPLLDLNESQYDQRFELWPNQMSDELFRKISERLNLLFVTEVPLPETTNNLYVISINQNFWLKSNERTLKYAGLDTNERKFLPEEFVHDKIKNAMNYAFILSNRLWAASGVDNAYFFKQRMVEELEAMKGSGNDSEDTQNAVLAMKTFNFKAFSFFDYYNDPGSFGLPKEEVLSKVRMSYENTITQHRGEIDLLGIAYSMIENPPIYITKVAGFSVDEIAQLRNKLNI